MKIIDLCEGNLISLPEKIKMRVPAIISFDKKILYCFEDDYRKSNKKIWICNKYQKYTIFFDKNAYVSIISSDWNNFYDEKIYKGMRKYILNINKIENDNRYEIF